MEVTGKSDLMDAVKDISGSTVAASQRIVVNELLLKLESQNPTEAPATSPLLNGVWELVYSGGVADGILPSPTRQLALFLYAGGYGPGQFGLQVARMLPDTVVEVKDVVITITREQPRAMAATGVTVGGTSVDLQLTSTLETESDLRLRETYSKLTVSGREIVPPEQLLYSRLLFVTYLDDDLLVVRDETGAPEILFRKSKEFVTGESTGEPSFADDDLAPGAG